MAAIPALPVLSVRFPVLSVLLVRSVDGAVVMVRRRSTVRFRNGAPGHGQFFEQLDRAAWNGFRRRSSAPIAVKALIAQQEPGRQLRWQPPGGPSRDSLVTVRGRSRWAGRPAAGRFYCLDEPHQDPGSAWRLLVSSGSASRRGNECLDHGCESGWAVTSEARMSAHRCMPSGSPTSSSRTGGGHCPAPYAHADVSTRSGAFGDAAFCILRCH